MKLLDSTLADLLRAFSSSDPTPGGGSASALAAAVGAALLAMVAGLPKNRTKNQDERRALAGAAAAAAEARDRLGELVDLDSNAYDAVTAAYRLPKTTEPERQARHEALQRALVRATEIPLEVMRASLRASHHASEVARYGRPSAASDVGVALELLGAGLRGAALNVCSNLEGLSDRKLAERIDGERVTLEKSLADAIARARALLGHE